MIRSMLSEARILEGIASQDLDRLAAESSIYITEDPHVIFGQGASALALYLLLDGEVEIRYKPDDGDSLMVTRVRPGGVFGWSAAIGRDCYTSSAVATTPIRAIRTDGRRLRALYTDHPETGEVIFDRLARAIAGRIHSTKESVYDLLVSGMQASHAVAGTSRVGEFP